jgi:hypothetical protein
MQRFLNRLRSAFRNHSAAGRPRAVRPRLEQLDDRLVPSATSAITTSHVGWGWYGAFREVLHDHTITVQHVGKRLLGVSRLPAEVGLNHTSTRHALAFIARVGPWYTWQTHDLFAISQATHQVIDFRTDSLGGRTRTALGGPQVTDVSASVDPNTGFAEVFARGTDRSLWRCDSSGKWTELAPGWTVNGYGYGYISATRDGQVYAVDLSDQYVQFFHADGSVSNLGNPEGYRRTIDGSGDGPGIAAGIDPYGGDEVFAIGQVGALYVYSGDGLWAGTWRLIDSSRLYIGVSATPSGAVIANQNGLALFRWAEQPSFLGYPFTYWSGQQLTFIGLPYQTYWDISADTGAWGQDEVYSRVMVAYNQFNLYRYDQVSGQQVDINVSDVAAAGGGYFFDVNPTAHGGDAWAYDPNRGGSHWIFLGGGVE